MGDNGGVPDTPDTPDTDTDTDTFLTAETPDTLDIGNERISIGVAPDHGGRVAFLTVDGVDLIVRRGSVPESAAPTGWGAYPMVPWAGRIRDGRFAFRGREHHLPLNFGAHAIHGVGFAMPWRVIRQDATSIELDLKMPTDARWPFGGVAHQSVVVDGDRVELSLSATATDCAFPASIGWHPWFRTPTRVEFHPTAMYRRDRHGITIDELVDVPPGPWDDCFVNERPVVVTIGEVTVTLTSDCREWVVYDERPHATCIEPQTGPPDALNIRPHVLEPGESLTAWYTFATGSIV